MKKLYIKNKFISIGNGSYVEDETGTNVFKVKGKVFSPTHKKFVYDMDGNLLYIVRNKWWKFIKHSVFIYDGKTKEKLFRIKERFFSMSYEILDKKMEIGIAGKLFQGLTVYLNGTPIGVFKRCGLESLVRDAFQVDVQDENYAPLLAAIVIAYDNLVDNRRGEDK